MKLLFLSAFASLLATAQVEEIWQFDNLADIGGHSVTVLGHPRVVGNATEFNGIGDALFLNIHPLAGANQFTWETIFRPDPAGAPEQRFFHLQVEGSDDRMLFEIRLIGDQWCLDTFVKSGADALTLLDRSKLQPVGRWYSVAAVYDGVELRSYVDGVLQASGKVRLRAQGRGGTSVGVRFNKRDYFKGAMMTARMTKRALVPAEFLKASSE